MRFDLVTDELPDMRARVVVAGPPWYPGHTRVFLWAAARLTSPGVTILLAQPAVATRPGVLPERAGILAFAHDTGLETIAIIPGALACICPPFERHARHASQLGTARRRRRPGRRTPLPGLRGWARSQRQRRAGQRGPSLVCPSISSLAMSR